MNRRILAATIVAVIAVVLVARSVSGDASDDRIIRAAFKDASGLRKNSLVEVAGQPVGRVAAVTLDENDVAIAHLRIDERSNRVGVGATAKIRPANLLGEKYVDLEPGDRQRPVANHATIPTSRTGAPVELDDVLGVLDAPTRVALSVLINETGKAITGRGDDFAKLLRQLPPALDDVGEFVDGFKSDNGRLATLVSQSDRVVSSIEREREELGHVVDAADGALGVTAERASDLGATIRAAAPALAQLRDSLARVESVSQPLGPASDDLKDVAEPLTRLLDQVGPLATAVRPTLNTASDVAPSLTRLAAQATPALKDLRAVPPDLDAFADVLDPFTRGARRWLPDTLGALEGWARAIQNKDASGHVFRNDLGFTPETLTALLQQPSPSLDDTSDRGRSRAGSTNDPPERGTGRRRDQAGSPSTTSEGPEGPAPSQDRTVPTRPATPTTAPSTPAAPSSGSSLLGGVGSLLEGLFR